jgi:ribosomal-protein-alanine N-acetyltransferase
LTGLDFPGSAGVSKVEWKKITIQEMEILDLDEVISLESSNPDTRWSKNMFVEEMKNPSGYCFVMKMKDRIRQRVIGFICFRNVEEESELFNICVHPDYRRSGVGKRLMGFYVEFGRLRGIKTYHLEVLSSNQPAIHLYRLFSYESSGTRKKFYQGKFDALLMTKKA